jgi:hypothetical protein
MRRDEEGGGGGGGGKAARLVEAKTGIEEAAHAKVNERGEAGYQTVNGVCDGPKVCVREKG